MNAVDKDQEDKHVKLGSVLPEGGVLNLYESSNNTQPIINFTIRKEDREGYQYELYTKQGLLIGKVTPSNFYYLYCQLSDDTYTFYRALNSSGSINSYQGDKLIIKRAPMTNTSNATIVKELILKNENLPSLDTAVRDLFTDSSYNNIKDNASIYVKGRISDLRTAVDRNYAVDKSELNGLLDKAEELLKEKIVKESFNNLIMRNNTTLGLDLNKGKFESYGYRVTKDGFDNIVFLIESGKVVNNNDVKTGTANGVSSFDYDNASRNDTYELWFYLNPEDRNMEHKHVKIDTRYPTGGIISLYETSNSTQPVINFTMFSQARIRRYVISTKRTGYLGEVLKSTAYYLSRRGVNTFFRGINGLGLYQGDKVIITRAPASNIRDTTIVKELVLKNENLLSFDTEVRDLFTDGSYTTIKDTTTLKRISDLRTAVDMNYIVDKSELNGLLDKAEDLIKEKIAKESFNNLTKSYSSLILELFEDKYKEYGYRITKNGFENVIYQIESGVVTGKSPIYEVTKGGIRYFEYYKARENDSYEVWLYFNADDKDREDKHIKLSTIYPEM
jgi:hypothetical protein